MGFVLPIGENEIPKINSFTATSAKAIEEFFKNEIPARLLYTVIAQPLAENMPFFCLLVYGTDDRYSFDVVQKRWLYIRKALEKKGITVVGQSTDGDSRAFKKLRLKSNFIFGNDDSTGKIPEFKANIGLAVVHMQDTVHLLTKLKNRLLKTAIILPMEKFNGKCVAFKNLDTKL